MTQTSQANFCYWKGAFQGQWNTWQRKQNGLRLRDVGVSTLELLSRLTEHGLVEICVCLLSVERKLYNTLRWDAVWKC